MTFFTLLYHSGDDGSVVVTPPPTVSGPGSVGGYDPRKKGFLTRKEKQLLRAKMRVAEGANFPVWETLKPPPDEVKKPAIELYDPPQLDGVDYDNIASRIEIAARDATAERMRLLKQQQMLADDEEAIALLLLMN